MSQRLPVLVGIGTAMQRHENPLDALDPLGLMLQATRAAGADCGAPHLLAQLDEILVPKGRWRDPNPAASIAREVGAPRVRSLLATVGVLQQTLIGRACAAIAAGTADAVLVVGGDAGYRLLRAGIAGIELPPPQDEAPPDEIMAPHEELRHPAEIQAGLRMPVGLYAIIETAWRARRGLAVAAHRDQLAQLYSRFSAIAAANPDSWTRQASTPPDIRDAGPRNPMQAFPYTRLHCSSWNVDQASALLFCSAEKADALGIAADRRIYPWASAESNFMQPVCARDQLDACPGAAIAGRAALAPSGLSAAGIDLVELYSCFPVAVESYAAALEIPLDRDLTVTGGMSFAGGPYNNYVLHATCRMAALLRAGHGQHGLVGSVSGILTKQGFGLLARTAPPSGFAHIDVTDSVASHAAARAVRLDYAGPARIAGYTVLHDRKAPPRAIIIADLPDGARAVATSEHPAIAALLQTEQEFCGAAVALDAAAFSLA